MDDETVKKAGTARSRAAIKRAHQSMLNMLTAWEAQMKRIETGQVIGKSEMNASLSSMAQAETNLVKEIQKNEERVLLEDHRIESAPIDFDGLRDEIGRRLARLRAVEETD